MLNDRNEKYDHEESEYHFSDEDINYEVETESPKPAAAAEPKEGWMNRLMQSKRMLISAGVFVVLVFVVYKMVTPANSPVPATNIAPTVAQQARPLEAANPPTAAVTPQMAAPQSNVMAVPGAAPVMPTQAANVPAQPTAPVAAMPMQPAPMAAPTVAPQQPAVAVAQPASNVQIVPVAAPAANESRVEILVTENQRLMGELQAEYSQKLNDYAAQNKALQEQMEALNTRVASMEGTMNQLMQVISRVGNANANATGATAPAPAAQPQAQPQPQPQPQAAPAPEVKLPYSVQAIIPGRAWLRSDNGETVTVAEGDVIKDVGRVTKIDPYNGVVEINTGNRVVSISYGSGV